MLKLPSHLRIWITLLIAAGILVWAISRPLGPQGKRIGFQGAAPPLVMPLDGNIDHRFQFLSAWQSAEIPTALRFDPPMGVLAYNAQKFWDLNDKRGGHHAGDDLNGIGGMNSDLGDPVYAVADGLVIYAGEPTLKWGKTVVIAHRTADGRVLHSMYSHLERIHLAWGALVARGQLIAAVGTGNDHYPAHLHFEMRESDHVDIDGGYLKNKRNRLDPVGTVAELRNAPAGDEAPSPLAIALQGHQHAWTEMEIQGAEIFSGLPSSE